MFAIFRLAKTVFLLRFSFFKLNKTFWKLKKTTTTTLFQPQSDNSAFPGAIWAKFKPKQPHQIPIPAHAGTHFHPWVQINPYSELTERAPFWGAKTDHLDLECACVVWSVLRDDIFFVSWFSRHSTALQVGTSSRYTAVDCTLACGMQIRNGSFDL